MRLWGWVLLGILGGALVIWPEADVAVAARFFTPGAGFILAESPFAKALVHLNHAAALVMALGLALAWAWTALKRRPLLSLRAPAFGFLLVSLALGPGLLTNTVLKEHWGRARPNQITAFGGSKTFTPAGMISHECTANCSFVSGDVSFVVWLHAFAYVVPRRRRRIVALALGLGAADGVLRMTMGGHFLSDVLFAGWLMILTTALVYALVYGRKAVLTAWGLPYPGQGPTLKENVISK